MYGKYLFLMAGLSEGKINELSFDSITGTVVDLGREVTLFVQD